MSKKETIPYRELLLDSRWFIKKAKIIKRDNYRCAICGSLNYLVVHHKQYHFNERLARKSYPWEYDDKYLITLCQSCHTAGHNQYEIPVIKINK